MSDKVKNNVISFPEGEAEKLRRRGRLDEPFTVLVLLLIAVGLVCLYSASYADALYYQKGKTYFYVLRQGIFAGAGVVAMFLISRYDYHKLKKYAIPLLLFSFALLGSIKVVPSVWKTINRATRWISLGFTTFQPSEIAKFAMILFCAALADFYGPKKMRTLRYGILPFFAAIGVTALLLYFEPHMSATIIVMMIGIVIIFLGGANMFFLGGMAGAGAAGMAYLIFAKGYSKTRINVWLDPFDPRYYLNSGWQGAQSLISVGSGGLWGLGLGQGRQKQLFLPEPANDFVFAVICEEMGFVGAVLILILFAYLICRGYIIAMRAPDRFGTLLAAGITTQVAVQVILNIAVVTGLIPVTGVSLPFFSYGGTSLMILLCEMGVLLNISRAVPAVEKA